MAFTIFYQNSSTVKYKQKTLEILQGLKKNYLKLVLSIIFFFQSHSYGFDIDVLWEVLNIV